jgi:hypothetical protein
MSEMGWLKEGFETLCNELHSVKLAVENDLKMVVAELKIELGKLHKKDSDLSD